MLKSKWTYNIGLLPLRILLTLDNKHYLNYFSVRDHVIVTYYLEDFVHETLLFH